MPTKYLDAIDLQKNELQNARIQNSGTAPSSPVAGQVYWDTVAGQIGVYDGSGWDYLAAGTGYTDEQVRDVIGTALVAGNNIDIVVNDAGDTITIDVESLTSADLTDFAEAVSDQIGTMVTGNTETGITVTYDDSDNTLDFVIAVLNSLPAPTGSLSLNSQKITNLLDGTATTDAINLGQLNAAIEGRQWKDPVATSTTGALPNTPTYNSGAGTLTAGSNTTLAAQAGHTMVVGERILVQNQASTFQNGIYTMTATGSGAAPWVLTRAADASTAAELSNATVMVEASDSTLKGKIYTQQNTLADLTAATQSYTVTGDNNVYTADGTTLTLSGSQFSIAANGVTGTQLNTSVAGNGLTGGGGSALAVNPDGTTIEINTDAVRIAAGAAGAGLTGGGGSALAVGAGTGITVNANDVAVDTAVVARKAVGALTGGATSEVLTHNLGTRDVVVDVINNSSPWEHVHVTVESTSTNTVTIRSGAANLPASYRWIVVG